MNSLERMPFTSVLGDELEEIGKSRERRGWRANEISVIRIQALLTRVRPDTSHGSEADQTWRANEELARDSNPSTSDAGPATDTSHGSEADQTYSEAGKRDLFGLAFSGGGIRSATLNLGILQGLARYGLLKRVDYLSTVSGGGYIGGWLTSWIKRSGLDAVVDGLKGKTWSAETPEPKEISFLRSYSNYLTPRKGALSADTWSMIAIYLRNLLLMLTVLVLGLAAVLLIPRLFLLLSETTSGRPAGDLRLAFMVLLLFAGVFIAFHHIVLRKEVRRYEGWTKLLNQQWAVQVLIVAPLFLAAWFAVPLIRCSALTGYEWTAAGIGLFLGLVIAFANWKQGLRGTDFWKRAITRLAALPAAGLLIVWSLGQLETPLKSVSGGLYDLVGRHIARGMGFEGLPSFVDLSRTADLVGGLVFGVPAVIVTLLLAATLYVGLMGRDLGTEEREWWARLMAWAGIYSVTYTGLFAISLIGPALLIAAEEGAQTWFNEALASGWILTTLGGLLAGDSSSTGGKKPNKVMELVAGLAPYIFIVGFLVAIAWFTAKVIPLEEVANVTNLSVLIALLFAIVLLFAAACVLSWRFDVNEFSIHNFYRNRLVRCYLGATDLDRHPHPFTGFDPKEHYLRTSDLLVEPKRDPKNAKRPPDVETINTKHGYDGPYHLLNTTLNLASGENLAWQQRMARSFVFAPIYSGHEGSGHKGAFRPTSDYNGGVSLGTAVAISGAAASPNMGYHSSTALAFLMTVFNIRLGWWLGNPKKKSWAKAGPTVGLKYLFSELFGLSDEQQSFVYLSDGGHFENLGIYELVRRRCRYIIACDGGSDAKFSFEDLGNATEKCRTDFGINIKINVDGIRPKASSTEQSRLRQDDKDESKCHCAVGTIEYKDAPSGTLLYLKSSLTGNEPTDVERYKALTPDFPHQSTGDQFFDESQFESYRSLGRHIVEEALWKGGLPDQVTEMPTDDLFGKLSTKRSGKSEQE